MDPNIDAAMREIISEYLITGNVNAFVIKVNNRYKEIKGLRKWI